MCLEYIKENSAQFIRNYNSRITYNLVSSRFKLVHTYVRNAVIILHSDAGVYAHLRAPIA